MVKKAISVTLRPENLLWLRAQAHASSRRSVSETLDELISGARAGARGGPGAIKSVVGSIRIRASDPGLTQADGVIRGLFSASAARRPLPQFFADLFSNPAYQPVDLTPEQIYQADAARPNRDPFDALICAAARHLELALLTRDDDIRRSGLVRVIW